MKARIEKSGLTEEVFATLDIDGHSVKSTARRKARTVSIDEEEEHELPDAPPPGWAQP